MKKISWLCVFGLAVCTSFAEEVKQDEPTIEVEVRFLVVTGKNGLKGVDVLSTNKLPKHVDHLSTRRVVTKSGLHGSSKVATEYIYPTEFGLQFPSGSGRPGKMVEPLNFTMQEVGAFVDVTPTWNPEDNTIVLDITPSIVGEPTWHGHIYVDEQGKALIDDDGKSSIVLPFERPHFPVLKVSTKLKLQDGVHTIFGGFQELTGKKKRTYYFVIKAAVVKTPEQPK